MIKKNKRIVTFHRTYEIEDSIILEELINQGVQIIGKSVEHLEKEMDSKAERIARRYLEEEMSEFLDNSEDFVSATIERV